MHKPDLPTWRREIRASRWALQCWREADLPGYDQAAFSLSRRLWSYFDSALAAGEVTREELDAFLPEDESELLGNLYRESLGLPKRVVAPIELPWDAIPSGPPV